MIVAYFATLIWQQRGRRGSTQTESRIDAERNWEAALVCDYRHWSVA